MCTHQALVLQFLLTKVVVASPPSPMMSPSVDCSVVWRWEINGKDCNAKLTYLHM